MSFSVTHVAYSNEWVSHSTNSIVLPTTVHTWHQNDHIVFVLPLKLTQVIFNIKISKKERLYAFITFFTIIIMHNWKPKIF